MAPAWFGPVRHPPRKATVGHVEVAPVLLHQQVRGRLRDAEERVHRNVDRHRRVDAVEVAVVLGQLEARLQLDERQAVRRVAVHLVRRREDERRVGRVGARRLEQVECAVRVDGEVGLGVGRGPVVRGLRGRVDDELDRLRARSKSRSGLRRRRECRRRATETRGRSRPIARSSWLVDASGPKKRSAHVVLEPDHVVAGLDEVLDGLRADQAAGAGDDRGRHVSLRQRALRRRARCR